MKKVLITILSDLKSLFRGYRWINYFLYRVKHPYLSLPPSAIISGKIVLEENISIGKNTQLIGSVSVGRNSTINENCKIYGDVNIGDNCLLSNNIFISSGGHTYSQVPYLPIKEQDTLLATNNSIIIEDDCWIGINVVVMSGVTIGKGSVIGANSVVTKDVAPYSIAGGVPARLLKKRLNFVLPTKILWNEIEHIPYFYQGFLVREYEKKRFLSKDGFLTKKEFTLKLNIEESSILYIEVRRYNKKAILIYDEKKYDIFSQEFILLEIDISKNKSCHFFVTEPIVVRGAYV